MLRKNWKSHRDEASENKGGEKKKGGVLNVIGC